MKYIDTGSRRADQTLGDWLTRTLRDSGDIAAIRWQSGFFTRDILRYFRSQFEELARHDGLLRVLVGSNEGQTRSADLRELLKLAGAPRQGLQLGVVSYEVGYFHPKTVHILRTDGSQTAYVGSANLTRDGAERHVEAGVVLDTAERDDPLVLQMVARAIDDWFCSPRPGMFEVAKAADLDDLVQRLVLDRPRPPRTPAPSGVRRPTARLTPLRGSGGSTASSTGTSRPARKPPAPLTHVWTKTLSASDAQRKEKGNQRGSITLVQGANKINGGSWFRRDFLKDRTWVSSRARTGRSLETTSIEFEVSIRGRSLGLKTLSVSFDPDRESKQRNYTSLLHLGDLSDVFAREDLSGLRLTLARTARGDFFLCIL